MFRIYSKPVIIILLLLAVNAVSYGSLSPYAKINLAQASGEIDANAALINRFYFIVDRVRLPARFRPMETVYVKCGTQVMLEIQAKWAVLPEAFKQSFNRYFPDQLAVQTTYSSTHFDIHWGDNLTYNTDADSNGVPDVAELWAQYFEATYQGEVTGMGFDEPSNMGGSRYNIYLGDTWSDGSYGLWAGVYGYMQSGSGTSYIVVRQEYNGFPANDDPEGDTKGAMKVTAAHEFHHAIQIRYDPSIANADRWWMEATSTWMEDAVYDQVNDYVNYLNASSSPWRNYPHTSLALFNGIHEYGDVIWAKYISETYATSGDTDGSDAIKGIWQNVNSLGPISACDSYFQGQGSNMNSAFHAFAFKNLKMDYEEGSVYGSMKLAATESSFPVDGALSSELPDYLGCNYVRFNISQTIPTLSITFNGGDSHNSRAITWKASVVRDDGTTKSIQTITLDSQNEGAVSLYNLTSSDTLTLIASVISQTGLSTYGVAYAAYPAGVPYTYSIQLADGQSSSALSLSNVLNFPNPFADATTFNVGASRLVSVEIAVYDRTGYLVKELSASGTGVQVQWDGRDTDGNSLPNGVYFYLVRATDTGGNIVVKKGKCAKLQ